MGKFNTAIARPVGHSPIATDPVTGGTTHEGGPGFGRDAKSELFLLGVSNMVGEPSFYETAHLRDNRYGQLIGKVAQLDLEWLGRFLLWLRSEGNMRSAALVGALEAAHALGVVKRPGGRQIIASVLQRADEPGEALAYWTAHYGRNLPMAVKRGVADAVRRLYTEYALLKYDTSSHGFRFADVIELTHPKPSADKPWQGDLFQVALERRHKRDEELPLSLPTLVSNTTLRTAAADHPDWLLDGDALRAGGFTWEDALSLLGSRVDKAMLWEKLIPSMGYMALLRNLRNFDEAGVSDLAAAKVAARLSNPEQVAKARQFPFRFLAAYRNVPSLRWGHALDKALTASLANIPPLPGRSLILVDISGSMDAAMSGKSQLNRADAASVFGAGLARRTDPTLVWFNGGSGRVEVPAGGSLLRLVESIPKPSGGTYTASAVARWYAGHDRVVIITDEQTSWDGDPGAQVPQNIPVYTFNLAGYQLGHMAGVRNRHTIGGGLTDAAFRMVPLLEAGRHGRWPWEDTAAE